MTREQHLLICLAEECSEVIKEVTKILRFGLIKEDDELRHTTLKGREVEPNGPRLQQEIIDIMSVIDMLIDEEFPFPLLGNTDDESYEKLHELLQAKKEKVEGYIEKAKEYKQIKE